MNEKYELLEDKERRLQLRVVGEHSWRKIDGFSCEEWYREQRLRGRNVHIFVKGSILVWLEQKVHRGKDGAGIMSGSGIWMESEGKGKSLYRQTIYMHFASGGKALKFHRAPEI